jgi:hypothetical protein
MTDPGLGIPSASHALRNARRCVKLRPGLCHSPFSLRVLMSPVDRLAFSFMAPVVVRDEERRE